MKRLLLIGLVALIIIPTIALGWLLTTESGMQWSYQKASSYLPDTLSVAELTGSMNGPLDLYEVRYQHRGYHFYASRITLDWNPWDLLIARVGVSAIKIESLDIVVPADSDDSGNHLIFLPSPSLPYDLSLDNIEISALSLRRGSNVHELGQVSAHAVWRGNEIEIRRLQIDNEQLDFSLQGKLNTGAGYAHEMKLDWQALLPSGATLEGRGQLTGDLESTRLTQVLQGVLQGGITLEIQDFRSHPVWQSQGELTAIDTVSLDSRLPPLSGRLQLSASGDMNTARMSGQLEAETDELGAFSAQFSLGSLDGAHRFDGLKIETLDIQALKGQLLARGQLMLRPEPRWDIQMSVTNLDPARWFPQWPGDIEAQLTTSGGMENGSLVAGADITRLHGSLRDYPVSMQSQLNWKNAGLDISRLNFTSGNTRFSAVGRVDEKFNLSWSLESNNLAELYPRAEGIFRAKGQLGGLRTSPSIKAAFEGSDLRLPDYTLETVTGEFDIDLANRQQFDFKLSGQALNLQGYLLQTLEITADPDRIIASATNADMTALMTLNGTLGTDNWRGSLVQADIQTRDFLDWKLKAATPISLSLEQLVVDRVCLLGGSESEVCARVEGWDETWKVDLDVNQLALQMVRERFPAGIEIDGAVTGKANLAYDYPDQLLGKIDLLFPAGKASFVISEGGADDRIGALEYRLGTLVMQMAPSGIDATTTLALINGDQLEGRIKLPAARLLTLDYQSQPLQAKARLKARDLGILEAMVDEVEALQGALDLDIEASGSLANPRFKGTAQLVDGAFSLPGARLKITSVNIDARGESNGRISYRATGQTSGGILALHGDTRPSSAQGWLSNIRLEGKSLHISSLMRPWMTSEIRIKGLLDTTASMSVNNSGVVDGTIDLSSASGSFSYPLLEGELENWGYRNASISLDLDEQGIQAMSEVEIGDGNILNGIVKLPQARFPGLDIERQLLEGELTLNFRELAAIEALVPEIDQLQGSLALHVNIDGSFAEPELSGQVEIPEASVRIPRLGLSIDQISLHGATESDSQFRFQIEARSAGGSLSIQGSSQLDAARGWPTVLNIKGDNFEVSHIPEAVINVSPDLVLSLQNRSVDISGDLLVPYARLQPKDVTRAAQVSNDSVVIGGAEAPATNWLITTRINLELGERVNFFGYGFEGRLKGRLLVEEEPGQLTRGTGEINIPEGRYRAYGQRLDIENGRVLFTGGPLTDPGLDIRAIRTTGNVIAGIQVNGRLRQPRLDLFSIPAMGQTDTLSYLLLGRPMESASGEDGALMAKAALALGLVGGDRLARSIGDRFGFDEMRIESNDVGDQASLVVGRYLSPRLYVSYGVGLIESFNSLNLRYQISEKWQLKAESGESHGADFLYTIER